MESRWDIHDVMYLFLSAPSGVSALDPVFLFHSFVMCVLFYLFVCCIISLFCIILGLDKNHLPDFLPVFLDTFQVSVEIGPHLSVTPGC